MKQMTREEINNLKNNAIALVSGAVDLKELEELRVGYLGRKGKFNERLKEVKQLEIDERKVYGQLVNEAKNQVELAVGERKKQLKRTPIKKKFF